MVAGDTAALIVLTEPQANCAITVYYRTGPSRARGLEPKRADGSGLVGWAWVVGTATTAGTWPISVVCAQGDRQGRLRTVFTVLK